ncbi:type VI secretion system Vgr family protein [Pseudoduganella umbonata]|uniref:Type VI secretion system secreted protein VgrG n=1 Tax=Pseudoduganella umbonata TaxID=864828 RepID=A0A7W5ED54_9BURK|nr:type VI secretion system Vgr family protein [Pseudoduganella umbonata]MBB3223024.1 type VI secretion system secreted protein VgrG [Pseudoduganella umbonata]
MTLIPPGAISLDRLQQTGRLLRSHFPNGDGPDATLVVNTLSAREELSRGFCFAVELLSDDVSIPLKSMIGKMMTVSLVRDDGTERHFNGYITEFRYAKTDGGFVYYQAVLEPWLAFAKLRKDCVSFLATSVLEMTEKTFAHYKEHDWKLRMRGDDPKVTCMNQYNETDYNHLHRRWEAAGLHYWYEHRLDGHTLWLSDDSTNADGVDVCGTRDVEPGTMPYRAYAGSAEGDGIRQWQAVRRVGPCSMTLGSFDYKNPVPQAATYESMNQQGEAPSHEIYENLGAYGYRDWNDGEPLARCRMEESDRTVQFFEADGNDRSAMPGRSFVLADHHSASMKWPFQQAAVSEPIRSREYLIAAVQHTAANNFDSAKREPSYYKNSFTCLRKTTPWRPGRGFHSNPPPAPGVQTAIVTGPQGEEIHTDGLGRITIQFHWDRLGKRDENSSAWVRVAMPMAGKQFGQIGLPRVGQEVVVQFLGENPDRPIVTGVVYNAAHAVPWELSPQRALSGLRSRELGDVRGNQLVLDDTKGEIQAQLRSDHLHSQLSLGQIHRLEENGGHKEKRGAGFELRTDGHGVARAAEGLLLTTEARAGAAGPIKAMAETTARLTKAHEQHKSLATLAGQHAAGSSSGQSDSAQSIAAQIDGIKGGGGDLSELSAPHVVLSSAAGIAATAAQSVHVTGAQHLALTAGANLSMTAQGGFFASVREGARVFVQKLGMKLIAATGKVEIRAESDDIDLVAEKVLRLLSETDWIELRGRKGLRLHGAGSMIEIADKVQVYSQSPVQFHCNLETLGARNRPQPDRSVKNEENSSAEPADERMKLRPLLQSHSASGAPYAETPYVVYKDGAEIKTGLTNDKGQIEFDHERGTERYEVMLANGDHFTLRVEMFDQNTSANDEKAKSNEGYRALNDATDGREHKY